MGRTTPVSSWGGSTLEGQGRERNHRETPRGTSGMKVIHQTETHGVRLFIGMGVRKRGGCSWLRWNNSCGEVTSGKRIC